jgi:anti-sigma B factor antagonist
MEIVVEHRQSVTIVGIIGNVDGLTAEKLLTEFQARVEKGHIHLVCDLSGVSYTSSAGLRALLAVVRFTRSGGGDLRLAAVNGAVLKVLELSGFTSILKVFPDVNGAVASYSA